MSHAFVSQVWTHSIARGNARLLLLAIADCCDHEGVSTAHARHLRKMTGLKATELVDALTILTRVRELEIDKADGQISMRVTLADGPPQILSDEELAEYQTALRDEKPGPVTIYSGPNDWWKLPEEAEPQEPAADPRFESIPKGYPRDLVGLILSRAGVPTDPMKPLYWMRTEHHKEAEQLLQHFGTIDQLLEALATATIPEGPIRRLSQIEFPSLRR